MEDLVVSRKNQAAEVSPPSLRLRPPPPPLERDLNGQIISKCAIRRFARASKSASVLLATRERAKKQGGFARF